MSDRRQIEEIIGQYYAAINSNDISGLSLAEDVEFTGTLAPEPIRGESEVRQYLSEVAPFILNIHSTKMIIENGTVASLTEFDGVNGVHTEGTVIFDVENGKIIRIRGIFDTRPVFAGSSAAD